MYLVRGAARRAVCRGGMAMGTWGWAYGGRGITGYPQWDAIGKLAWCLCHWNPGPHLHVSQGSPVISVNGRNSNTHLLVTRRNWHQSLSQCLARSECSRSITWQAVHGFCYTSHPMTTRTAMTGDTPTILLSLLGLLK